MRFYHVFTQLCYLLSPNEHEADCSRSSTWFTTLQSELQQCSQFFMWLKLLFPVNTWLCVLSALIRNINCRCPHVSCCKNQNLAEESLWIYGGILNLTHKKMFLLFGLSAKEYVLIIARIVFMCLIFIIFLMKWLYKVKEVTLFQVKCNKAESIYNNSHFFFFLAVYQLKKQTFQHGNITAIATVKWQKYSMKIHF